MFTAGIELFFGFVAGAGILAIIIMASWLAYEVFQSACRSIWKRVTVFPGVLVPSAIAGLVAVGLLLRYS